MSPNTSALTHTYTPPALCALQAGCKIRATLVAFCRDSCVCSQAEGCTWPYIRGEGTDVPLPRDVEADSGEGSILVHHARYLSREVVGGSLEHLSHVTAPGWRLFWPAEGVTKQHQWGYQSQRDKPDQNMQNDPDLEHVMAFFGAPAYIVHQPGWIHRKEAGDKGSNKSRAGLERLTAGMQCVAFPRSESIRTQSQRVGSWYCSWRVCGEEMELCEGRALHQGQPWAGRLSQALAVTPYLSVRCSSLKMCTVSVLLEAQRNWESMLNTRELMFTYLGPSKDRTRHFMAYH